MCFYYNESEAENTQVMIAGRKDEELTKEEIVKLTDDFSEMGVRVLTLHGGEPLVYPGIFEISKYAAKKGLLVNFITNGVLLNEKNVEAIIDAKINSLTISIDGPPEIHDSIRGMQGAFGRIEEGIRILREKELNGVSVPKIGVSTYVSAVNQDSILQLFDSMIKMGIANWGVGLVTYNSSKLSGATRKILGIESRKGQGNLDNLPDELTGIDAQKFLEIRRKLKKLNSGKKMQVFFPSEKAINKYSDPLFNEMDYCLYPWARVIISPYGEVFPCVSLSMVDAVMGNIKIQSIKEIWNGEKYVDFRKKLKKNKLLPSCSKCCVINNIKPL